MPASMFRSAEPAALGADTVRPLVDALFESAGAALTTLLNHPTTVAVDDVAVVSMASLGALVAPSCVVATAAYQRGLKGTHWLIVPAPTVRALGRLLLVPESEGLELLP